MISAGRSTTAGRLAERSSVEQDAVPLFCAGDIGELSLQNRALAEGFGGKYSTTSRF
jgi:hypothetical protein